MEPSLNIPRPYQTGLAKISALEDEPFQDLLSALRDAPLTIGVNTLASHLASKVQEISQADARHIVTALLGVYSLRNQLEASVSGVATVIARAMEESNAGQPKFESEKHERLRERLIKLLDLDSLDISRRASSVLLEYEHVLREARIMTDIRPVFGADLSEGPIAAVIVHMLKIVYEDSDAYRDIFVALDTEDISMIRELLERADTKAESLRQILGKTDVSYVDPR